MTPMLAGPRTPSHGLRPGEEDFIGDRADSESSVKAEQPRVRSRPTMTASLAPDRFGGGWTKPGSHDIGTLPVGSFISPRAMDVQTSVTSRQVVPTLPRSAGS